MSMWTARVFLIMKPPNQNNVELTFVSSPWPTGMPCKAKVWFAILRLNTQQRSPQSSKECNVQDPACIYFKVGKDKNKQNSSFLRSFDDVNSLCIPSVYKIAKKVMCWGCSNTLNPGAIEASAPKPPQGALPLDPIVALRRPPEPYRPFIATLVCSFCSIPYYFCFSLLAGMQEVVKVNFNIWIFNYLIYPSFHGASIQQWISVKLKINIRQKMSESFHTVCMSTNGI